MVINSHWIRINKAFLIFFGRLTFKGEVPWPSPGKNKLEKIVQGNSLHNEMRHISMSVISTECVSFFCFLFHFFFFFCKNTTQNRSNCPDQMGNHLKRVSFFVLQVFCFIEHLGHFDWNYYKKEMYKGCKQKMKYEAPLLRASKFEAGNWCVEDDN